MVFLRSWRFLCEYISWQTAYVWIIFTKSEILCWRVFSPKLKIFLVYFLGDNWYLSDFYSKCEFWERFFCVWIYFWNVKVIFSQSWSISCEYTFWQTAEIWIICMQRKILWWSDFLRRRIFFVNLLLGGGLMFECFLWNSFENLLLLCWSDFSPKKNISFVNILFGGQDVGDVCRSLTHYCVWNLFVFYFIYLRWNYFSPNLKDFFENIPLVGCWGCLQISHTLLCLKSLLRTTLDIEIPGKSKFSPAIRVH